MARGEDTGAHPGRQVGRARFGVGDVVHIPGVGPTTVGTMGKRYFTGTTAEGASVGDTSIGLAEGASMGKPADPWKVERS